MRKHLVLIVLIVATSFTVNAQRKYPNTFVSAHVMLFADFILTPQSTEYLTTGMPGYLNNEFVNAGEGLITQSFMINTLSLGAEIRHNVLTINDNLALEVSLPLTLGYGEMRSSPFNEKLAYVQGYGSLQLPILFGIHTNCGSTYSDDHETGFSFRLGSQYTKMGLVRDTKSFENIYAGKTSYFTPVATIGVHFWLGSYITELRLKGGMGFSPESGKTLSLSIHTLFNY